MLMNIGFSRSSICYILSAFIAFQLLFLLIHNGDNLSSIRDKSKNLFSFKYKPTFTAFPHKIWQTSRDNILGLDDGARNIIQSWSRKNPSWRHETLTQSGGSVEFMQQSFKKDNPELVDMFIELQDTILKADMIRYLALYKHGGLYSDLDTVCLKPIEEWIPEHSRGNTSIVVGVEYDALNKGRWNNWTRDLQFTTWAILAKPEHPLLKHTMEVVMKRLKDLTVKHKTKLSELHPSRMEVLDTTGPAMFTDSVFEYLSRKRDKPYTWKDISDLKEPLWIEDVLILPIEAFGCGQAHSNSKDCNNNPKAYVQHLFRGSWKSDHPE